MISTSPRHVSSEHGSLLIEVLVAAVLVAVMGVALFGALNSSAKVSGVAKTRAGAAAVAQDDQERLRATPVAVLNNMRQHRDPVVLGKIAYTVDSRADWIADGAASTDCTKNGDVADYLKITSTVTAKGIALKPVVVISTVTPAPGTFTSSQGSLALTVVDRNGAGIPGLTVNIAGPTNDSDITDEKGCAFFGYEPAGDYTASVSASGYVDVNGGPPSVAATISGQTVSTQTLKVDRAGTVQVKFLTTRAGAGAVPQPTSQPYAGFANAGVTINQGTRVFGNGTPQALINTGPLVFPFPNVYSVFAGDCSNNDPLNNGATATSLLVEPGKTDHAIDVTVPSLNVQTLLNGVVTNGLTVTIKSVTAGCAAKTWPTQVSNTVAGTAGLLADPGFPYGTYTICADNKNMAGADRHSVVTTVALNAAAPVFKPLNVNTTLAPLSAANLC